MTVVGPSRGLLVFLGCVVACGVVEVKSMVVSSFVGGVFLENDAGTETPTLPIGAVFSWWGLIGTSWASSSLGEEHALSAKEGGVVDLEESTVVGSVQQTVGRLHGGNQIIRQAGNVGLVHSRSGRSVGCWWVWWSGCSDN